MNKLSLIMISTFQNFDLVNKLVESLSSSNKNIDLQVVIVNQTDQDYFVESTDFTKYHIINYNKKCGLSKARNIAINYINNKGLFADHYMFPDDDSSYDSIFFEQYNNFIKRDENYLINVLNTGTSVPYKANRYKSGQVIKSNDYGFAMSVNQIISYDTFTKVNIFDENLGVGAEFGAAEDADYYLRCATVKRYIYISEIYNYHPANLAKFSSLDYTIVLNRFKSYSKGFVFFALKHKLTRDYYVFLVRAIVVMFYYLIRLELKLVKVYWNMFFYRIKIYFEIKGRIQTLNKI